jgi:hypothetical protein
MSTPDTSYRETSDNGGLDGALELAIVGARRHPVSASRTMMTADTARFVMAAL